MVIEVIRIGQRPVRDDRVTTHVALVARAFGAARILMSEVNPEIKETIGKVCKTWGGDFQIEIIEGWRPVIRRKRDDGFVVVHLSMYGQSINEVQETLKGEKDLLVVVGAEKVPREIYELADYNVGVGCQPHSEISALAVLLDRIGEGGQFEREFPGGTRRIVPSGCGSSGSYKNVIVKE